MTARVIVVVALLVLAVLVAGVVLEGTAVRWATDWLLPPSKSGGG